MGMDQLFCGCAYPEITKMESGNHWCEDCCGLIEKERIRELNKYCKCEIVPETYVHAKLGEAPLHRCSECRKVIKPGREIRSAFEILCDLPEDKSDMRMTGPALVICESCGHHDWCPHNENVDMFVRMLNKQTKLICSRCRKASEIPDQWKGMIK